MTDATQSQDGLHRVVIVGGGFGGLYAARELGRDRRVDLTLVDRRNFHLFQPLLYQVATGALSPGDIAQPLRAILRRQKNTTVILGEATGVDLDGRRVILSDGGPTGVELAGAIGEIAHDTLRRDFRSIRPPDARIVLVEMVDRVLTSFPANLSRKATLALERLGVAVRTGTTVVAIDQDGVTLNIGDHEERLAARTVLWAAGVRATSFGHAVAEAAGATTDRAGRMVVAGDLSLPGHPDVLIVGDLAQMAWRKDQLVPGVAQGAIQSGRHAARVIRARLDGRPGEAFRYKDKGNLATIGRGQAVADLGRFRRFSGFPAWVLWLVVHILYLVGFANRVVVMVRWAWSFFTHGRATRLITGKPLLPEIRDPEPPA